MAEMTYRRRVYEVRDGIVHCDGTPLSRAAAGRAAPAGSALRDWLRSQGADLRASGTGGAESRRTTRMELRLPPEAAEALERLREGRPANHVISELILEAAKKST